MNPAAAALADAVDDVLAVHAGALSGSELHCLIVSLQRQRARLAAAAAALVAAWDERHEWASNGALSPAQRLANDTGASVASARADVERARHLAHMPGTAAALASGRLSVDAVDLLARVDTPERHERFVEAEAHLVDQCAALRYAQATKVVARWRVCTDAALGLDGRPPGDVGRLHVSCTFGDTVAIDGHLEAVPGAIFTNELHRLEQEIRLADQASGLARTRSQRQAAALVEMANRSANMPADARRARPLFTVQLGDDSFSQLCDLANGVVVSPAQLLPWLDTAELETVLFDGPSTAVSVSRRRSFTGALRRVIELRDQHCQHSSGCDIPAPQCDVDHIVPAASGGPTSQFNGALQCPTHNRDPERHARGTPPPTRPPQPITARDVGRAQVRWRMSLRGWDFVAA